MLSTQQKHLFELTVYCITSSVSYRVGNTSLCRGTCLTNTASSHKYLADSYPCTGFGSSVFPHHYQMCHIQHRQTHRYTRMFIQNYRSSDQCGRYPLLPFGSRTISENMSKKTDISCHKSSNVMLNFGILWQVWEPLYRTFGNESPNGRAKFLHRTDLHQPIWKLSVVLTPAATWNSSGRKAVAIHHID